MSSTIRTRWISDEIIAATYGVRYLEVSQTSDCIHIVCVCNLCVPPIPESLYNHRGGNFRDKRNQTWTYTARPYFVPLQPLRDDIRRRHNNNNRRYFYYYNVLFIFFFFILSASLLSSFCAAVRIIIVVFIVFVIIVIIWLLLYYYYYSRDYCHRAWCI